MKIYKLLESYKNENISEPSKLDAVTVEFKNFFIDFIKEQYLNSKIKNQKTKDNIVKNITSILREEYNTLTIPYFYILENINLCIEVEMSEDIVLKEKNQKFGETKFSQILESGISKLEPINRFSISEKQFLKDITDLISEFTNVYEVSDESIKLEFN